MRTQHSSTIALCVYLCLVTLAPPAFASVIAPLVRRVQPSVVVIRVTKPGVYGLKESIGAGVVVDAVGHVLTASHVVANARTIRVTLADGTDCGNVTTEADDPQNDLALLSTSRRAGLTPLPLARAAEVELGQEIIVIGHPFGYRYTVTRGIVSGLDREIEFAGVTGRHFLQTDAAINPGNSGGPLVTEDGLWIGLVTALRDGANGIAFAIPATTLAEFLDRNLRN